MKDVCMPVRGSETGRVVSWVVSVESEGCVATGVGCRPQVSVRRHLCNSHLLTSPTAPSLRIGYTLLLLLLLEQPPDHDVEQSPEHEVEEQPLAAPPLPHKHLPDSDPKNNSTHSRRSGPDAPLRDCAPDHCDSSSGLSPLLLLSAPRGRPDKVIYSCARPHSTPATPQSPPTQ